MHAGGNGRRGVQLIVVGSSAAGGTVTVTYWTEGTQAEINYIDTQFDKSHPGIKAVGQYIASADESTAKEVSAIKSGTEPNVVIGQDPSALPLLAESGKVVDLTAALKTQTAELYPGIRSALFYQGKQLGMALGGVGDYVLFYNKKDFAAAGHHRPADHLDPAGDGRRQAVRPGQAPVRDLHPVRHGRVDLLRLGERCCGRTAASSSTPPAPRPRSTARPGSPR